MRNFLDKTVVILITFIIFGCSNNCINEKKSFVKELQTINKVKDIMFNTLTENFIDLDIIEIKKRVKQEDFKVLSLLNIEKITKISDAMVFSFVEKHEKKWIEKKLESNFKSCKVHLIYSKNKINKEKIINYEQYSECRTKLEDINNDWVYILQFGDCN